MNTRPFEQGFAEHLALLREAEATQVQLLLALGQIAFLRPRGAPFGASLH